MKNWRLWVGIVVSLLCLFLVARGIDFRGLLQALSHVNCALLLPAFGLLILGLLARAFRWRLLLYPVSGLRMGRLFNVLSIGYLVNNVSPLRLGDVLRAYLCAELQNAAPLVADEGPSAGTDSAGETGQVAPQTAERLSMVRALSTIVVERIADTLTVIVLLLLIIPFIPLPIALVHSALGIGLLTIVAIPVLALIASKRERALAFFDGLVARLAFLDRAWLRRGVISAVDGLAALGSWRTVIGLGAWSLLIWISAALQFYIVMWAVGLHLPFVAAWAVLCFTTLGMTVPSSPGYIGVFEYFTVLALSLFDMGRSEALGYALVLHAFSYLALLLLGGVAAWIEGYSYARLRGVLAQMKPGITST